MKDVKGGNIILEIEINLKISHSSIQGESSFTKNRPFFTRCRKWLIFDILLRFRQLSVLLNLAKRFTRLLRFGIRNPGPKFNTDQLS